MSAGIRAIATRPPPGRVGDLLYSRVTPAWNIRQALARRRDTGDWFRGETR